MHYGRRPSPLHQRPQGRELNVGRIERLEHGLDVVAQPLQEVIMKLAAEIMVLQERVAVLEAEARAARKR